ncbi:MAG: SRPBCC family protein [Mesorhizobium sp.]
MTTKIDIAASSDRELVLARIIDAPRASIWRCWTESELVTQWFVPKPWSVPRAEMDVRPGGSSLIVMADPDGNEYPNPGVYLDVVPNEKLVFTDAFTSAWQPSGKPFMVGIVTLEDAGEGRTRYVATARHWTVEDREQHEKMGFHEGWGICAEQLEALAKSLS